MKSFLSPAPSRHKQLTEKVVTKDETNAIDGADIVPEAPRSNDRTALQLVKQAASRRAQAPEVPRSDWL